MDRYKVALKKKDETLEASISSPSQVVDKLPKRKQKSLNEGRTTSVRKVAYEDDNTVDGLTPHSIGLPHDISSRIGRRQPGTFETETLTLDNLYAALRYLQENKFSQESRLVVSEFLGRYYYYIGLYRRAYLFSSFVVDKVATGNSPAGRLLLPSALAVSGWSSLRLGKSEQSKKFFSQLQSYNSFSRVAAAGLVATDNQAHRQDWEEPADWLSETQPSLIVLQDRIALSYRSNKHLAPESASLASAVDASASPSLASAVDTSSPAPRTASVRPAENIVAIVPPVNGAPGDGTSSLAEAMKRALGRQGIKLASAGDTTTYKIQGHVELGAVANGQQPITIRWVVIDPSGKQMEKSVVQLNNIVAGSLDGAWGEVAEQAAGAAASQVIKLLPSSWSVHAE